MEITLKQLGAIRKRLEALVYGKFSTDDNMLRTDLASSFNVEELVANKRNQILSEISEKSDQMGLLVIIRKMIGNLSHANGINDRLTEIEMANKHLSILNPKLVNYQNVNRDASLLSVDDVSKHLLMIKTRQIADPNLVYTKSFKLLSDSDVKELEVTVKGLRKVVQKLNDEISGIQYNVKVSLSDDVVSLLNRFDLM